MRPHRILLERRPGPAVSIQVSRSGGAFTTVKNQLTNRRGFIKHEHQPRRRRRARWRLVWQNPDSGETFNSRVAKAGKRLKYYTK